MYLYYSIGKGILYFRVGKQYYAYPAYSGAQGFVNRPSQTDVFQKGPIPQGLWDIGVAVQHKRLGAVAIPLTALSYEGKRSAFFIHGDNAAMNQTASKGCIVTSRAVRDLIGAKGFTTLVVHD